MERISLEQAKHLVPYDEDLTNATIDFFTLTPDPKDERWDIVTYYTARKDKVYENRDGDGDSWVYVLSNPSMPNLLKIGSTTKEPDVRAKQIGRGTGVPTEFEVEYAFRCFNAEALERELHKHFRYARIRNQKEFFQIKLEEVVGGVEELGKRYL